MPPAAKHFDPLVGIDVHIIQPPGPVPPVPVPHPYTGMLMDPCDYAPFIGGTVKVGGLQRAQAGTGGISIPKHIPIGGVFVKPPADESEMFMGSSTVAADGDAFSYLGLPALSCQCIGMPPVPRAKGSSPKSLVLPTTVCLSIPLPVSVGGSPTVSLMALGMKAGMAALGALAKKVRKGRAAKKAKGHNGGKCKGGDPVDIVTGAVFDDVVDAQAAPPWTFAWSRHYTTLRAREDGPLGHGFRHGYAHRLLLDTQATTFDPPSGDTIVFEPLEAPASSCTRRGATLTRQGPRHWDLRLADRMLAFERIGATDVARLVLVRTAAGAINLEYDGARLSVIRERCSAGVREYAVDHDAHGRIVGVRERSPSGDVRRAAYAYDRRGDLVASVDAASGQRRYGYDDHHRWISRQDPCGFTYTWRYDADGRCTLADSQDGLWRTAFAYEPETMRTLVTEPSGGVYAYHYDDHGTLRRRVDPEGGVLERIVDEDDGQVRREIDSGGRAIRWLYDERGGHVARADRFGHVFPPELEVPNLPDPLAHRVPSTPRAWVLGSQRDTIAPAGTLAAAAPASVRAACPSALAPAVPPRWTRDHDGLARVVAERDEHGRARSYTRDRAGNVVATVDRDGCTSRTRIASWNLPVATIDGLGNETRLRWNATEQLVELVDPGGCTSRYDYDAKDRLVSVARHGRVRETYVWDVGDQLVAKRDGEGRVLLELTYGDDTLIATRTLASGEVHRFAHDARGALVEASTDAHEVRMAARPDGGRLHDLCDGRGVEHAWVDGRVRRTHVLGRFVSRWEHARDGSTRIVDPTGAVHRVRRDADGLVLREHTPGRRELSRFDPEGRCIARIGWSRDHVEDAGPEWVHRWSYSAEGDLVEAHAIERSTARTTRYVVDAAHRLCAVETPAGRDEIVLDAAGNLERKPGLVGVVMGDGNRLRFANGEHFEYDARDSLCRRTSLGGAAVQYRYDALDRLVAVEDGDARGPWTASYDAIGRRIDCGRGASRRRFWYDGDRLAAECDADGRLRIYVYAAEDALVPIVFVDYDGVDAEPEDGRVHAVFTDHLGMPLRIENHRGLVVWRAEHVDAYGAVTVDPHSSITFDLRWPGHVFDADTGLHYNRHRYYDPVLGRYLQSDPIGTSGGTNLYAYAANPVTHVDLLGLHAKPDKPAKPKDGQSPNAETPVKRGDVGSYAELKSRAVVKDGLEHDHIPSKGAVRDKINAERAARGEPPLTREETNKLYDNLTAAEVDKDVHRAGNTYGGKNTDAKRAADGANLEQAATNDLDAHRDGLKSKGMTDEEIDAMNKSVQDRNREIGVYDDPLPSSLWE